MLLFGWFLICSAAADSVSRTSFTNPDSWAASSPARSINAANSFTGPESQPPCGRPGPPECPRRPLEIVGLLDSVSQGSVRHRREAGRGAYPTTTATGRPSAQRCDCRFSHLAYQQSRGSAGVLVLHQNRLTALRSHRYVRLLLRCPELSRRLGQDHCPTVTATQRPTEGGGLKAFSSRCSPEVVTHNNLHGPQPTTIP